jgi:hypothetical protein
VQKQNKKNKVQAKKQNQTSQAQSTKHTEHAQKKYLGNLFGQIKQNQFIWAN